jgi:pilus assembly protein CpaD
MALKTAKTHKHREALKVGVALAMAVTLGACASGKDAMSTGSVASDYRKTHPILVAEQERKLQLIIASDDKKLSFADTQRIEAFAQAFRASGAHQLKLHKPRHAANQRGVNNVTPKILHVLRHQGIGGHHLHQVSYDLQHPEEPGVVHLSYKAVTASVEECGIWETDINDTFSNKNYANFGCASQANFAAQIADPKDLVTPRAPGPIDAEQRQNVLGEYKTIDERF